MLALLSLQSTAFAGVTVRASAPHHAPSAEAHTYNRVTRASRAVRAPGTGTHATPL